MRKIDVSIWIQRLFGVLMVILGVVSVIPDVDISAAVLLIPLGLFAIFTKKVYTIDRYYIVVDDEEEES